MANPLTRRELAGAVLGSAAALAQSPGQTARTPDEELEAARAQNRRNAEALAKVQLPMSAEPAFRFSA